MSWGLKERKVMKKKDLIELIKSIQDNQDVDETLKDSELAKKFGGLETFKEKMKSDSITRQLKLSF